jgi:autotransporter-associated beta strand protein
MALTQNSAGNTLTLTGANTYAGGTTIATGTLRLAHAGRRVRSSATSSTTAFLEHFPLQLNRRGIPESARF